jgi:hypothetical protein
MISYLRAKSGALSYFVLLELITQALSLSAGFLLIRLMEKQDYGLLTIANSLQAALIMLIDSGISVGVMAVGGSFFADRIQYGKLIATAIRLRTYLAGVSIATIAPLSIWLLLQQKTELLSAITITIAILLIGYLQIQQGIHLVTVRLAGKANQLQFLNLLSALARWGGIGFCFFWLGVNSQNILCTWVVIAAFQNFVTVRIVKPHYSQDEAPDKKYKKALITSAIKIFPGSLYLMLQSQLVIWVLTVFGEVSAIADLGALSRLAMVFIVASSVMVNIVTPRFSQIDSRLLPIRYLQIIGAWLLFCSLIVLYTGFFPESILWILGEKYGYLKLELLLMVVSAALSVVSGHIWSLNASRGWIPAPWRYIPILLVGQVLLMWLIGISSLKEVLLANIGIGVGGLIIHGWVSFANIYSKNNNAREI